MTERGLVSRIVFPAPRASYTADSFPELIFIPKNSKADAPSPEEGEVPAITEDFVPCLMFTCPSARFILIFFHTNAEDLGWCYGFCSYIRDQFQVHVLAVEYPGYGIAPGVPCGRTVIENAIAAYKFTTDVLKWPEKNIKVFGRSIGTGPAMALASLFSLAGVILVTPFISVQELFRDRVGPLSALVEEWFANDEAAAKITSPTIIIHGQRDALITCRHGQELFKLLKARKLMISPPEMEHNTNLLTKLDFFVLPMFQFFTLPDYTFQDIVVPDWAHDKRRGLKKTAPQKEVDSHVGKENVHAGSTAAAGEPSCDAKETGLGTEVWGEKTMSFAGENVCTPDGMCAFEDRECHAAHGDQAKSFILQSIGCGGCGESGANPALEACRRSGRDDNAATLLGSEVPEMRVSAPLIKNPRTTTPGAGTVQGIFEAAKRERQLDGNFAGKVPLGSVAHADVNTTELRDSISKLELRLASDAPSAELSFGAPCPPDHAWSHRSLESVDVDMMLTEDDDVCREARWGHRLKGASSKGQPAIATVQEVEEYYCDPACNPQRGAGCVAQGPKGFDAMMAHDSEQANPVPASSSTAVRATSSLSDPLGGLLGMPLLAHCCQQLPSEPLLNLAPPKPSRPPMLATTIDNPNMAYSRSEPAAFSDRAELGGNILL